MTAPNRLRALREKAADLDTRLAAARYAGRSADGLIAATVTGRGRLVDLRIDDAALSGVRRPELGVGIVVAVQAARNAALEASGPEVNALFGTRPSSHPGVSRDRADHASPRPTPRSARDEADYEENFDEVDFLSDEEDDRR
ncbi:YbaB/EbfC family nucleoid-associated protein [Amycolatopsis sp. NPDC089917]|uniref:YbaB/EbfC family nucleoid-associated protein n=1 Tax=Amycolatopsis sp. NPDC089917 TaxID=3155187 RepID=UPI003415DD6D